MEKTVIDIIIAVIVAILGTAAIALLWLKILLDGIGNKSG